MVEPRRRRLGLDRLDVPLPARDDSQVGMAHHDRLTLDRREQVPGPARQMEVGAQPPGPGHQDGRRTPDRPRPACGRRGHRIGRGRQPGRFLGSHEWIVSVRADPLHVVAPGVVNLLLRRLGVSRHGVPRRPRTSQSATGFFGNFLAGARMLHIFGRNSDPRADNEGKSDRRRRPVCHRCDRCGVEWTAGRGLERPALRPGGADARQLGIARRPIGNGPPGRTDGTDRRTDGRWRRRAPRVGSPTERRHTERARRPDPGCPPGERKVVA